MDWTLLHRRADGTFIIQRNGYPYHVTADDPLFTDVAAAAEGVDLPPEPLPEPPVPQPVRLIAPFAFRRRLSAATRQAVTLAASRALERGDATLQTWLDDIAAARVIDLDDPELVAGVAAIHAAELITDAERAALLADGTPAEAATL